MGQEMGAGGSGPGHMEPADCELDTPMQKFNSNMLMKEIVWFWILE